MRALQDCSCSLQPMGIGIGKLPYWGGWGVVKHSMSRDPARSKLPACGVETLKPVQATKRASFTPLNNLWPALPLLLGGGNACSGLEYMALGPVLSFLVPFEFQS